MQNESSKYDNSHLRHLAEIYDYVAEVTNPAAFTVPATTFTKVPFQSVIYDPSKMWDADLRAFRIPFTGLWRVEGGLRLESTVSQYRYILTALTNNTESADTARRLFDGLGGGQAVSGSTTTINANASAYGNTEMLLREGDILEIFMYHTIASTRNYPASTGRNENRFLLRAVRRLELGDLPVHPY